jgi:hypothetical protein
LLNPEPDPVPDLVPDLIEIPDPVRIQAFMTNDCYQIFKTPFSTSLKDFQAPEQASIHPEKNFPLKACHYDIS